MRNIYIAGHGAPTYMDVLREHPNQLDAVIYRNFDYPHVPDTSLCKSHLHLVCDDVDGPRLPYIHPTKEVIRAAVDFAQDKEDVLCVCHAGVSRSSSTALVIATKAWGIEKALSILVPGGHYPNRLIVALRAEVIGVPELWPAFVTWQTKATGVDPSKNWTPFRGQPKMA